MKVNRLLETALYAEDLDTAEEFYTSVLGLTLQSREPGRHIFFYCGSSMFLVFNPLQTESESHPHGSHGPGHVAWAVSEADLDDWRKHLASKDIPITREISWPGGGHSIYFSDPAGNSLELVTPNTWGLV